MMPLLSRTLTARGVDDPDLARLKGVYQFSWYRNTMLFTDAAALLRQLGAADISTMLLRGAAIAIGYRSDVGMRAMNDMDVLVPSRDHAGEVACLGSRVSWRRPVPSMPAVKI